MGLNGAAARALNGAYVPLWTIPRKPVLIVIDHRYAVVVDILVEVEPECPALGEEPGRAVDEAGLNASDTGLSAAGL